MKQYIINYFFKGLEKRCNALRNVRERGTFFNRRYTKGVPFLSKLYIKGSGLTLRAESYFFLSSITSQFLSFFHWIVFDLFFLLRDSENDVLFRWF